MTRVSCATLEATADSELASPCAPSAVPLPESHVARASAGAAAPFAAGQLVAGRYWLQRSVGRGGMGEVFEALDLELHERIALKTLLVSAGDPGRRERRLKEEVQLARRATHPNVCRIFDFGRHASHAGKPEAIFLTMEFIEGESLARRLERGRLPLPIVTRVAQQLLAGLGAVHAVHVLHRDLKSANVMLRSGTPASEQAVLTDFGLARARGPEARTCPSDCEHWVGSIGYMAPEQVTGADLDFDTDIYAFGVICFEMLTGRLPFNEETAAATARARASRDAPAASQVEPSVPRVWDEFVLGCMQRDRAQRFSNVARAQRALEAVWAATRGAEGEFLSGIARRLS